VTSSSNGSRSNQCRPNKSGFQGRNVPRPRQSAISGDIGRVWKCSLKHGPSHLAGMYSTEEQPRQLQPRQSPDSSGTLPRGAIVALRPVSSYNCSVKLGQTAKLVPQPCIDDLGRHWNLRSDIHLIFKQSFDKQHHHDSIPRARGQGPDSSHVPLSSSQIAPSSNQMRQKLPLAGIR
jgi:hypothetical protein